MKIDFENDIEHNVMIERTVGERYFSHEKVSGDTTQNNTCNIQTSPLPCCLPGWRFNRNDVVPFFETENGNRSGQFTHRLSRKKRRGM
jgi:hypothetical protein